MKSDIKILLNMKSNFSEILGNISREYTANCFLIKKRAEMKQPVFVVRCIIMINTYLPYHRPA